MNIVTAYFFDFLRDPLSFALTLSTTPFFVLAFYFISSDEVFAQAIPRVLVFAMLLAVFSSAVIASRGCENQTFMLLRDLGAPTYTLVLALIVVQVVLSFVSFVVGIGLALALGFEPDANWGGVVVVVVAGSVAHAGLGAAIGFVARDTFRAFAVSSVIMFLLMIFSGAVVEVPDMSVLAYSPTWVCVESLQQTFGGEPLALLHYLALGLFVGVWSGAAIVAGRAV